MGDQGPAKTTTAAAAAAATKTKTKTSPSLCLSPNWVPPSHPVCGKQVTLLELELGLLLFHHLFVSCSPRLNHRSYEQPCSISEFR